MINSSKKILNFDWVCVDKLAVGHAPNKDGHFEFLKLNKIKYILSLCNDDENKIPDQYKKHFSLHKCVLKDHYSKKDPKVEEYEKAIKLLRELTNQGIVYVHCLAGIERSPLTCIGWLIIEKNLKADEAYDYLKEIHPMTNPLLSHFEILKKACQNINK
mgnify:CR=1 FL=1|tara:strand:+ start:1653 stop:2129 length:477 start_codon:yes stop_codon:yes gene_type:complete